MLQHDTALSGGLAWSNLEAASIARVQIGSRGCFIAVAVAWRGLANTKCIRNGTSGTSINF
jgi:hypothetical protein